MEGYYYNFSQTPPLVGFVSLTESSAFPILLPPSKKLIMAVEIICSVERIILSYFKCNFKSNIYYVREKWITKYESEKENATNP